jgi:isopentenyl-diphosphate Delta-isomerase
MPDNSSLPSRKADHIRINLDKDVRSGLTNGLENYYFVHRALPEMDLEGVSTAVKIFGKTLKSPIIISSMTGGTPESALINQNLATAAQAAGVAMGVGSQRAGIEQAELAYTFQVRKYAPAILLFANLGAVQLNYDYTVDQCQRAVDMIEADALILHLNALQEALQPEGDTRFAGLLKKIEKVCRTLPVPVIAKEVGWGISADDARQLEEAGVTAIDVAGAGGTSWSQVEMYRMEDESLARVAADFRDWGIPTAESILAVRKAATGVVVFASGGLHDGIDIAKCIALGASAGGMAGPFLKAGARSAGDVLTVVNEIARELQVSMFAAGARTIADLQQTQLTFRPGR